MPFTSGHPDRHRRDPARAHRVAAGVARPARALRPYPGNHHPEFPGQARDPHGAGARARPRRPSVDDRRGAADLRPGDEHPGAAQSEPGRARRDDRGRDQRLGRRVAGDPRPRQPRGAVAGARPAGASAPPPPASSWSSGWRSIRPMRATPARWLDPALRTPVLQAIDAQGLRPHRRLDRPAPATEPPGR